MTKEEIKLQDLVKALDRAWNMKVQDKSLNFDDKFIVAPQVSAGKSIWAQWIRKGIIEPYHILWAFKETEPKQWLAIRISLPFKDFEFSRKPKEESIYGKNVFYFNLQSYKDRTALKQLEEEFTKYLSKSH